MDEAMDTSEVLEYSKENIRPLIRGRKTNVLGTALRAETDDEVRHNLLKKRDEYEIQLRCYTGEDPLQVWYEYLQWVQQNFPKSGREGNFHILLERCVAEFKDTDKYFQDERYVKVWILYLNQFNNPLEMYKQVHAHGIGTQCAIFYENWAEALERAGDLKRADKIYREGIKRNAQPLDDLTFAHGRFELRVARYVLDQPTESYDNPQDQRSVMARLKSHGRKQVVNNVRTGSSIQSTNPGILLPWNGNTRENNIPSQIGLKVYNDENADINDVVSDHIMKTAGPISRKDMIVKENTKKPGRWNEKKLKQNVLAFGADHASFPVHIDEDVDLPNQPTEMNIMNALKPRRVDDEVNIPVAVFEPPDPTKRPMYPKHKVYSGGTEFSLEELRAMRYNEEYHKKQCEKKLGIRVDENADSSNRLMEVNAQNASESIRDDEFNIPIAHFEPPDPTKRPMYPKHKVYSGGTEFSLEELRAMRYNEEYHKKQHEKKQHGTLVDENADFPNRLMQMNAESTSESMRDEEYNIPIAYFELADPTKRPMYPKHKVYSGGTEFSLEELRAVKYNEDYEKKQYEKQLQRHQESMRELVSNSSGSSSTLEQNSGTIFSIDEIQVIHKRLEGTATSPKIVKEELFKMVTQHIEPCLQLSAQFGNKDFLSKCTNNTSECSYGKEIVKYSSNSASKQTSMVETSQASEEPYDPGNTTAPINFTTTVASFQSPFLDQQPSAKKQNGPAFCLYVDDENDMKNVETSLTLAKQKQPEKAQNPSRPPPLPSFSMKGFLANELKVPKLHRIADPDPEQAESCESSDKTEQSFTVTTKEAMNVVHGLFKSPQSEKSSFVQFPLQNNKPVFTILMDDSSIQEKILMSNTAAVPKAERILGDENRKVSIIADAPAQETHIFKLPPIPYIPSPGRTRKELDEMGPDNKENGLSEGPKVVRTCSWDPSSILQPSKHIPFQPLEAPPLTEREDDLGVAPLSTQMFDETCNTQAFAKTLISSTPFNKNFGEAAVSSSRKLKAGDMNESYFASEPDQVPEKPDQVPEKLFQEPVAAAEIVQGHSLPVRTPGASLSVILETSREFKSSSSSGGSKCSTRRLTSHWATTEMFDPIAEKESREEEIDAAEDLQEKHYLDYPFTPNIVSELLSSVGFPAPEHKDGYIQLPWRLPVMDQTVTCGDETYQLSEYPDDWEKQELEATEMRSGRVVSLKARTTSCPWEYYISQEIQLRLKNPRIALYFTWIEKGFFFTRESVLISDYSEYGALKEVQNTVSNKMFNVSPLMVYWAFEMLDIVKYLHRCKIIHGNMWLENLFLHHIPLKMDGIPSLKLRNFEQAIDMEALDGHKFIAVETAPAGMEELFSQPLSYEMDLYKVAASLYNLMCYDWLKVYKDNGKWTCYIPSSRSYWQGLINELLNADYSNHVPDLNALQNNLVQQTDEKELFDTFSKLKNIL